LLVAATAGGALVAVNEKLVDDVIPCGSVAVIVTVVAAAWSAGVVVHDQVPSAFLVTDPLDAERMIVSPA
jgi:hypothetical protein